jgi:hypothetical protein
MSLLTAVLLLGQVGTAGQFQVPADSANVSDAVQVDETQPDPLPLRPRADSPQPPSSRAVITDDQPDNSYQAGGVRPAQFAEPKPTARLNAGAPTPAAPSTTVPPASVSGAAPTANAAVPSNSSALQVAATMVAEILAVDEQSRQHVRQVALVEALSRLGDPALQSNAIRAYWHLARCIAQVRYSSDKVRVLSEVASPNADSDRALLEEALAASEAEEAAAQDAVLAAQYELLRVTGIPLETALPWPADAPLVAAYRTQFESIYANRPAPLAVRQIHHSLPGKLWIIEKRLAAMAAAEGASDAMLAAYKGNRATVSQLLGVIERLDQSRQLFFVAIVDYNHQIAEYSLAAVGAGVRPETLVTTLIKSPITNSALVNIPRDVQPAAAAEAVRR